MSCDLFLDYMSKFISLNIFHLILNSNLSLLLYFAMHGPLYDTTVAKKSCHK